MCEATTRDSEVHVALGDGDDELFGLGDVRADGGEGNDRLDAYVAGGGPGDDVLRGGELRGGAGVDRLTITGGPRFADGGAGDDVLEGSAENDLLVGGPGRDGVRAGAGADSVYDDGNPDGSPEPVERDRLDGGPGSDHLSYSGRRDPVRVDLAVRRDQAPDHDDVSAFESVRGGAGDDVLLGDGVRDLLSGGPGDDRLDGRGGDDRLFGEEGDDRVRGGEGDDGLSGFGGEDVLRGGPGRDRLDAGYDRDRVDGGPGRDRLWTAKDFAPDRVRCDAADHGTADRGDRSAGACAAVERRPVRALWVDGDVRGREMIATVRTPTSLSISGYAGHLRLSVRLGRRWAGLGTHRLTGEDDETRPFRLPPRVAAALERRRAPLRGVLVLAPGRRAGMFPIRLRGRTFTP